jgi:hypothetical protein
MSNISLKVRSLLPALLALLSVLCTGIPSQAQVNIPGSSAVSGPVDYAGGSLLGEYWKRDPNTIFTDGSGNRAHGIDMQIAGFGAAQGTFKATKFLYLGNDLSPVKDWLSTDGTSFVGTASNLDDGAFRFTGFINITAAGTLNVGTTSDDGARIKIGGVDVTNGDGSHGDETHDMDAVFEKAGLYPIEITYFNGDWTDDAACPNPPTPNHSTNCPAANHGGANFHLRIAGADITSSQVAALLYPPSAAPRPLVSVGLNFGADDNSTNLALAATDVAGAVPQANWNNLNGASSTAPVANLMADSNGVAVATAISVEWSSPNTWSSTGRGEENNGFPPGADRTMMTGYIDTGNTDATKATVTVTGIPADFSSGGYDVLVYCLGGVSGRGGAYTIGGETKFGTAPASPTAHSEDPGVDLSDTGTYVRFRGLYTSSFTLTASADPALGPGVNFRAPINGIQIVRSQNPLAGLAVGYLTHHQYNNIGTSVNVIDLLNDPKYINDQFDASCLRTDFSANDADQCDTCGHVVKGYFIPSANGPHVFYLATDDGGTLFLSTDSDPANKVRIANEPTWAARKNYIGEADGGGRGDPPANISAPIDLVAGNLYYIEGAVKENGGGDNLDVAVKGPGDPDVMDGDLGIHGSRIATIADLTGSSLSITQNPASIRVPEGEAAMFTVGVDATSPLCGGVTTYQWQKNGVDIAGATSPTYSFGPVTTDDHLSKYRVIVRIPGIVRTSSEATLEVLGRQCLRVVSAISLGDLMHAVVQFNSFLDPTNGVNIDVFNYTINGGGLPVNAVALNPDGKSVTLTTGAQAENTDYTVVVENVISVVGTTVCMSPTNQATFHSGVTDPCGGVLFEAFNTGAGNTVANLTSHPDFPNNPDFRAIIGGFESRLAYPDNSREGYGGRMRALFIAPYSGDWVFFLASDDASELWLNPTGPSAAGKIKITEETGCCGAYTAHKSAAYSLTSGQGYYIEALYKEGTGGDYCRVQAQLASEPLPPGGNPDPPASPSIPGAWLGYPTAPPGIGGPLNITQQPTNQSVVANTSVTFFIGASNVNGLPIVYQWQRDSGTGYQDIAGATGASYTIPLAATSDNGAKFRVKVCVIGSQAMSGEATLTVGEDHTPPQCVSASGSVNLSNIVVTFSEKMAMGPAQDIFNYTVTGFAVVSATLQADGQSVLLQVDPALTPDTAYSVMIQNVTDLSDNPIASACTLNFRSWVISCGAALERLYLGLSTSTVSVDDLRSAPSFPNSPSISAYVTLLEGPLNAYEGYGTYVTGWLLPPVSGNYNFFMASDDGGEFWLSTDDSPANKVLLAHEASWANSREWTGDSGARRNAAAPENQSSTLFPAGIPLVAGQKYYFELLAKEGGGGDNSAVAWQLPGGAVPANGSSPIQGSYLAALRDPATASPCGVGPTIVTQPADQTVPEGQTATFSVVANGTAPITYQWFRQLASETNFSAVAGGTNASYTTPVTVLETDNNSMFKVKVTDASGMAESGAATLHVTAGSLLWMVGKDDDGWPAGDGGGPNASFVQENGVINPLPGSPTSPEVNQQADNDYYFAGTYTTAISSVTASYGAYTPVGVVAANEEAAERAFAAADNDLRYHFNLPATLQPTDLLSVTYDALNLDDPSNPANTDVRYGIEVYFNGVLVQTQKVIRPAQLNIAFTTPRFTAASVNAQVGAGFDNIVSLKGINYNAEGGGNWMGIDYVQLNFAAGGTNVPPPAEVVYNFNDCATPAGVTLTGNAAIADDGTGTNCVLHLTDKNQCGVNGNATFPDKDGGALVPHATFKWRSRVGGDDGSVCTSLQFGLPGADGYSFNWAPDAASTGVGEEGTGTGISVTVDTFDNGGGEAPATEIKYQGLLLVRDTINTDQAAAKTFLRKDQFVDAQLDVSSGGLVTFTYDGRTISATIPGWTGIQGGNYVFGARTGGAADNHWIDNFSIVTLTPGALMIVRQPTNTTVKEQLTATFSVEVNGTPPYMFQWYTNGVAIPGATSAIYTTPPTQPYDDGTVFTVVASNASGSVTSAPAVLTVTTDIIPPQCVSASVKLDLMHIVVRFDELMNLEKLGDVFNYTVAGHSVVSAATNNDSVSATLTLDSAVAPGSTNAVTIDGVTDLAGNQTSPHPCTLQAIAPVVSCGFAVKELYLGISGVLVSDLTSSPKYPASPDLIRYGGLLELNTFDEFDNYGARISGWLIPPVSGNYNFFMSSDDAGEFWLSTDSTPASLQKIAFEPQWNGRRAWTVLDRRDAAAPENRSTTLFPNGIPLTAGQMYYFEALMKEGGGGDNLAVAWQKPGDPVPLDGSTPIQGVYMASLADPRGSSVTITQQPTSQTFVINPNGATTLYSQDFNSSDGGFTVNTPQAFDTPWTYVAAAGSWQVNQDGADVMHPKTSSLTGTPLTVTQAGIAQVTFHHRYSMEQGFWDGGALQVSINGGDFTTVPASAYSAGGPNGTVLANSDSVLKGQTVFVQDSPNFEAPEYVTSTASVGQLNVGDTITLRFLFAADTNTRGNFLPSWEITDVKVTEGSSAVNVSFQVGATASGSIFYQWDRDNGSGFSPVPDANGPTLTLIPKVSDNGARFRVRLYTPGATVTSETVTLTVIQPNTPPQFTCGTNQVAQHNGGAQTVDNWATDIQVHSITRAPVTFASDFDSGLPANSQLLGVAVLSNGVVRLTQAGQAGVQGGYSVSLPGTLVFDTFDASWKSYIGDGEGGGADGYSFNVGSTLGAGIPGEEGTSSGLSVTVDTFDNGGGETGIEIRWQGVQRAFKMLPKDDDGTGNYLRKSQFVDAAVSVDATGLATFTYDGNTIMAQLPSYAGLSANQYLFGARTGGANDNQYIDNLATAGFTADASSAEANQTITFIVSNDNPSLFSTQPAVSPTGTLTYTPAANHCGTAHVTVVAKDSGGTANGGNDTSAPCTFDISVVGCTGGTNHAPVAMNSAVSVLAGASVNFQLMASDPDNDPLTYMVVGAPAHGTLTVNVQTGAASYTPATGYAGPDSFTFKVNDGQADSGIATVSITVNPVTQNHNPTASFTARPLYDFTPSVADLVAISCNGSNACIVLDASASSDPDNDPLTYSWFLQPSPLPFASGAVVNQCLEVGQHTIELLVSDGRGGMDTETLRVEVLTVSEGIETLIERVNGANIARKNKRPFIASLKAAASSSDRHSIDSAIGQLHAFQNKTRAQVSRGNPSEADLWIRWAQHLIDGLSQCQQ